MSIITISRGTFSGGKTFAENLAEKLGYRCLSREELSEEAVNLGVAVGKLQMAMVRPPRVQKRLGPEREHYLSCITHLLCKYALEGNLVYHGHTGHLLLPGIPNIFRVRVCADMEYRITAVMDQLNLSREKAIKYIEDVDGDRDKWVRFLYGVDWHDPMHYDLVVNLTQLGIPNATTALCSMAELPDFTLTPASIKALKNLYLASRARFMLAHDRRTGGAEVKVTADEGIVQVTYMPQDAEVVPYVEEILDGLEGCREVRTTIARNNILWLGEKFDPSSELFRNMVQVARKWDAAVEVMRIADQVETGADSAETSQTPTIIEDKQSAAYNGGIEEDKEENVSPDRAGVRATLDALAEESCSGGSSTVYGDKETLITTLGHRTQYSLVVVGDLFSEKPASVQKRLTSELRSLLADSIKAPVVSADELKEELTFRVKDILRMAVYLLIAVVLFIVVFLHQEAVINFLAGEAFKQYRILAILAVVLLVPIFAYSYGSFTRQIFKFLKLD